MKVKILLADDHNIVRQGLRSLIERQPSLEVVGEASSGRDAVRLTGELTPDMVIMDVSMPDLNGIEATRQIMADYPATRVLALSMHSDKRYVAGILRAGASGYLLKDCAFEEMAGAIQVVAGGGTYLSPGVTGAVVQDYVRRLNDSDQSYSTVLSPREREVLQLVAEGLPTRVIAKKLGVSVKTVETHRRQLMEKLDLFTVAELTKFAVREGLTGLE